MTTPATIITNKQLCSYLYDVFLYQRGFQERTMHTYLIYLLSSMPSIADPGIKPQVLLHYRQIFYHLSHQGSSNIAWLIIYICWMNGYNKCMILLLLIEFPKLYIISDIITSVGEKVVSYDIFPTWEYINFNDTLKNTLYYLDITRRIKSETLGTGVKHIMNETLHDIENTVSVSSTVNCELTT